ncbi:hypothetical protein [Bradyrhizobium diazoefficiens]
MSASVERKRRTGHLRRGAGSVVHGHLRASGGRVTLKHGGQG